MTSPRTKQAKAVKKELDTFKKLNDDRGYSVRQVTRRLDRLRTKGELFKEYKSWCEQNGEKALTSKAFSQRLYLHTAAVYCHLTVGHIQVHRPRRYPAYIMCFDKHALLPKNF